MSSQRSTMLGLGQGPDEEELKRLMEQEKPESTKGKESTIKYLSDPALLAAQVNTDVADAAKGPKPSDRVLFVKQLKAGSHSEIIDIEGAPLLMGDFANSDFKDSKDDQRMLLGLPRVAYRDGHLRITALEVNSPSGMNRNKIKQMIVGKHKAVLGVEGAVDPGLKPGMLDELKVDLDMKTRKLNTTTSGNGQRCFVLNTKMGMGSNGKPVLKDTIIEASQVEDLPLIQGDVIFVGSKKVMDALVMGTTNSVEISQDYYENCLANQILGILRGSKNKAGKIDANAVFQEIDQVYQLEMTINPREELVASSFVVYQVK